MLDIVFLTVPMLIPHIAATSEVELPDAISAAISFSRGVSLLSRIVADAVVVTTGRMKMKTFSSFGKGIAAAMQSVLPKRCGAEMIFEVKMLSSIRVLNI